MRNTARKSIDGLQPEILRLVEAIARTLAREHHLLETAGKIPAFRQY
jgi:hypothetical protein